MCVHSVLGAKRIARQYWRAWIETTPQPSRWAPATRIARQYWRAWIETATTRVKTAVSKMHRPPVLAGVD